MGRKVSWLRVLVETIGITTLASLIIGVPAMIAFASIIWHSLSQNQQIVASILVCLILLASALFIYGQTRKVLYVIPELLCKMYSRSRELAQGLKVKGGDEVKLALLSGVNIPDNIKMLFEESSQEAKRLSQLDSESLVKDSVFSDMVNWVTGTMLEQIKRNLELDKGIPDRTSLYAGKSTGLEELLATDITYQKLSKRLEKLRPIIPTVEITVAVNEYIKAFKTCNNLLPTLQGLNNELVRKMLPLPLVIDEEMIPNKIEEAMAIMLAKVRESIEKYYKGN